MFALNRLLIPVVGAAFAFTLAATPLTAKAETLRMANWLPPFHHMTRTLANWVAEVDKASGGTLKIVVLKAPLASLEFAMLSYHSQAGEPASPS